MTTLCTRCTKPIAGTDAVTIGKHAKPFCRDFATVLQQLPKADHKNREVAK